MSIVFISQGHSSSTVPGEETQLLAYQEFKKGSLYRKYAQANPKESKGIDDYWSGRPRPAEAKTATGRALLWWADVYWGF